jgi:hypothetical protein
MQAEIGGSTSRTWLPNGSHVKKSIPLPTSRPIGMGDQGIATSTGNAGFDDTRAFRAGEETDITPSIAVMSDSKMPPGSTFWKLTAETYLVAKLATLRWWVRPG